MACVKRVMMPFTSGTMGDRDGVQIAHKILMFQWQDGKKVIVWPEELAPGRARFPTPPWSQRP
jgi:branched-chain amino acid transport system substrate-binding protein